MDVHALLAAVPVFKRVAASHKLCIIDLSAMSFLCQYERACAGELSSACHMSKEDTSRVLARLQREELVTVEIDTDDQRRRIIKLTQRGRDTLNLCTNEVDLATKRDNNKQTLKG